MSLMIRGGTVVNADRSFRADVYCENGKIAAVGDNLKSPAGARLVDAGGQFYVPYSDFRLQYAIRDVCLEHAGT